MPQPPAFTISPRRRWAQPLADLVAPCIGPVLARQGFGEAEILMHWPEIVGEGLAKHCRPVKLQWRPRGVASDPEGRAEPATLLVRVEGAFALALQHMAPVVLERVNVYCGWRCVGKLVMKQGPLPVSPPSAAPPPRADPAVRARATELAAGVDDARLKAALIGLGSRVLAARR